MLGKFIEEWTLSAVSKPRRFKTLKYSQTKVVVTRELYESERYMSQKRVYHLYYLNSLEGVFTSRKSLNLYVKELYESRSLHCR